MAADDPVIPLDEFHALALPGHARVELSRWGGHCGFLLDARLDGFAEGVEHWNEQKDDDVELLGCQFAFTDLSGADFSGARLAQCNFQGAVLQGARFARAVA